MTPQDQLLLQACQRFELAETAAVKAYEYRRQIIRDLAAQGMGPTHMSRIYPLSIGRFCQLINGTKKRRREAVPS